MAAKMGEHKANLMPLPTIGETTTKNPIFKVERVAYPNVPHIHTHQLIVWRQLDFNTSMVRVSRNTGLGKSLGRGGGGGGGGGGLVVAPRSLSACAEFLIDPC